MQDNFTALITEQEPYIKMKQLCALSPKLTKISKGSKFLKGVKHRKFLKGISARS